MLILCATTSGATTVANTNATTQQTARSATGLGTPSAQKKEKAAYGSVIYVWPLICDSVAPLELDHLDVSGLDLGGFRRLIRCLSD